MAGKKKKDETTKRAVALSVKFETAICPQLMPGWKIVSSIVVDIERDDDGDFVVTDHFSTVYGNGETESGAVNDYCLSLFDYYEILEGQPRTPAVASALKRIRSYIKPTNAKHAKTTRN
jgi:hypothetical protein